MANIALIVNNVLSDSGAELGAANGVATLDSGGKIPVSQLPNSVMEFKGTWSAATNTPTLANGTGNAGDVYEVSAAGTVNFGAGGIAFAIGDYVVYDGATWQYSSGQKGTITSVALTMPSAFSVSGSPITTSGTFAITGAGTTAQYVRGDGTLATMPDISGFVPYTGATGNLDLGTHTIIAAKGTFSSSGSSDTVGITHSSGSGIALNITKGGNGEGIYVNKSSGSGNAVTIVGTLNATTLVRNGGTAAQFLKADGSIDSSTYLTTASAASTYLPLAGGTLTGVLRVDSALRIKSGTENGILLETYTTNELRIRVTPASTTFDSSLIFPSASRNFTFPNASGTIALTSDIPAVAGVYLPLAGGTLTGQLSVLYSGAIINLRTNSSGNNSNLQLGNDTATNGGGMALFGSAYVSNAQYRQAGAYIYSNQGGGLTLHAEGNTSMFLATNNVAAITINGSQAISLSGALSGTSASFTGNLTVSSGNTTGGGIIFADDGDIVDLNDAYLSLRFSSGVRVFSANRSGTPVITLANTGAITATGNITGANLSGTNTGDQTNISGNAGTVTNGVYTTGDQTIGGVKTFSTFINGGNDLRFLNSAAFGLTWSGTYGGSAASRIFDNSQLYIWTDDQTNFATVSTGANAEWYWRQGVSNVGAGGTISMRLIDNNLTVAGTISGSNLSGTNTGDQNLSNYVTLDGTQTITGVKTINNNLLFANSGTTKRGIQGTVGVNDMWFVGGGATAENAGFLEISTGDDAQTGGASEPIYVRQYGPGDPLTGTLFRSASLLDANGNTSFPGTVTASGLTINTGGTGTWGPFVVTSTSLWGDGATQYVTIGAGGSAGIMIYNPHIVWNGTNSCAALRIGRSGGVSTGAYYEVGTGASDNFFIAKNSLSSGTQLNINSSGNASFSGNLSATKTGGTNSTPGFQVRAAGGGPRIQTYGLDADANAWMGLGTDMAGNPYEHSLYFPFGAGGFSGLGRQTIGYYNGTTYSTTATFLASGRIGFGIASPEAALHVAQPGQDDQLILGSAANNRDHAMFMYSGPNKAEVMRYQSGTRFILGGSNNISKTSIFGGGSERLTVESGGVTAYRIFSTAGGGYNLIGGSAFVLGGSGATFDNSTGVRLTESYGPVWNCADGATWHHQVINGSSLVGISAAGTNFGNGNIWASGDITAYYSDMRLKTKISNIENALDKVLSLNGFYYTNNETAKEFGYNDEKVQVGVSAQEVEAILPEIVTLAPFDVTGNDNGDMLSKSGENYKTVKYDKLVPLLIEAIKELKLELDALNTKK
jgi:hypothetical protein